MAAGYAGVITLQQNLQLSQASLIAGGSLVGGGITTNANLELSNTTLDNVIVNEMQPGQLLLSGPDILQNAASLNINGGLGRWTGGNITLNTGSILNNNPGGTLRIECNQSVLSDGLGTFINQGTVEKPNTPGLVAGVTQIAAKFNTIGASQVNADLGSFQFTGGGAETGQFNVANGSTMEFGVNPKVYSFSGWTAFAGAGAVTLKDGGTFLLAGGSTVTAFANFTLGSNMSLATLTGDGDFRSFATFTYTQGFLDGLQTIENYGTMNLAALGQPVFIDSTLLTNYGTITWTTNNIVLGNEHNPAYVGKIVNNGTFNWMSGGLMTLTNASVLGEFFNSAGGVVNVLMAGVTSAGVKVTNNGTIQINNNLFDFRASFVQGSTGLLNIGQPGGSVRFMNAAGTALTAGYIDAGTVNVAAGSSLAGTTITIGQNATLRGGATITGNLVNNGVIDVANTAGNLGNRANNVPLTLTVNGDFTQSATGTLSLGLLNMANYSKVVVNAGDATLGGTLDVYTLIGAVLNLNDHFELIQVGPARNIIGDFDMKLFPPPPMGRNWLYNANEGNPAGTAVTLRVVAA
ncbi:MAG: hypothetical protein U0793_24370 [Gemmataceae bacterium]